jgi:flagellar hook-basal body complex protein FliE
MSIPAIGPVGFTPLVAPTMPAPSVGGVDRTAGASAASAGAGADFGSLLSQGMQNLQGLHSQADSLAVKAATGDLTAMHDYTITATEASVATQLTTAVRNKALEAFQEIMRMSV